MKGVVKTLNSSGHAVLEYDTEKPETVEEASKTVNEANKGFSSVFDGQTKERVEEKPIDPAAHEELIIVPQMAGGC